MATGKAERGVEVEGGEGVGLEKPVGPWGGLGFMLVQALRAIIKRSLTQLNELCRGKNEC